MKKRVYTYGQLDTLLHRRGEWGHELDKYMGKPNLTKKYARLYGNLFVVARRWVPAMEIQMLSRIEPRSYTLANVALMAGGDTLYELLPAQRSWWRKAEAKRLSTAGLMKWLRMARTYTPYDCMSPAPHKKLYRVRSGGAATELPELPPISLLAPQSTLPSPQQWVEDGAMLMYPHFCSRAKRFAARLIRELPDCGFQAQAQRIWSGGMGIGGTSLGALLMRVCTPPREREPAKILYVRIGMHDAESRQHFRIDSEYAKRHCYVSASESEKHLDRRWGHDLRWKSARLALAGIKEWLIPTLYIPGL
jgi:hypothetical protein